MNRFCSFFCVVVLLLSLTACSKQPDVVIVPTETEPPIQSNSSTSTLVQGSLSEPEIDSIVIGDDDSSYIVIPSHKSLGGQYLDSYSQRAVAEITENDDGTYHIVINWGNSAFETIEWVMDAALEDDKLVYNNCVNNQISVDENGNSETSVLYSDGVGYFEIVDDNLHWTGAADDNCRECMFSIMTNTD